MITIPYLTAVSTYFSYGLLFAFGQLRDYSRLIFDWWRTNNLQGYAPICLAHEDFYIRRLYRRIQDCFGRPISSAPDAWVDVVERVSDDNNKTLKRTTKTTRCLNLGSYNYLGFGSFDEYCTPRVIESLQKFSASTCSSRVDAGTTSVHAELEECVAKYVGQPAAVVFGMGYATNSAIIPVLIGKGGLIISDSLNHTSIVNGARGSGATIHVFQHNTPAHLEKVLKEQIAEGQPRTHRPWKKIIVVVEGIYSMEGEICHLPEIVSICIVLTKSSPKPLRSPSAATTTTTPPLSPAPRIPDQAVSDPDPNQISLRPLGHTGPGSSLSFPARTPEIDKVQDVPAPAPISVSPKPNRFVPPHLRPGFVRKDEKPRLDSSRARDPNLNQSQRSPHQEQPRQGYFGYGQTGRPKSGGYERIRTDPRSTGNRPGTSG